jgi:hypothetical protein
LAKTLDASATQTAQVIAWISHHVPDHTGKLVGGAEMTDATLLADAPVQVKTILPQDWKQAMDFDQVVITGTDLLSPWAMLQLAKKNPIVAVHHQQTQNEQRAQLLSSAKTLICRTPKHLELELSWTNPKSSTWVVSPLDLTEISLKPKEDFALWAARMHNQKGPEEAKHWANQRGIPLFMMHNKTRAEVLETMSRAKHFVFLPNGFDAEPRAVVEAVLSGCEVHTNDLAGITSIPNWDDPEVLTKLVSNAKELFWQTVLQ